MILATTIATMLLCGPVSFSDVTEESGIDPIRITTGISPANGGAAWLDWDADGHVDLLLTGDHGPLQLLRNQGPPSFTFQDVTEQAALHQVTGAMAVDVLQLEGQLALALVVAGDEGGSSRVRVLRLKSPGGAFTERAVAHSGSEPFFATHGDLDADGDHDLVVTMNAPCGHGPTEPTAIWRFDNDFGIFRPYVGGAWPAPGCAPVPTVTDYDNDGTPLALITNDFGTQLAPTVVVRESGLDRSLPPVYGMGIATGDINGDLVTDYYFASIGPDAVWLSDKDSGGRVEAAHALGMANPWGASRPGYKWGAAFFDADNDGDLELLATAGWQAGAGVYDNDTIQATLFINDGVDVAKAAGVASETIDRTVSLADFDEDGRMDVLVGAVESWYLYRNVTEEVGHWLQLAIPDAPGARFLISCGGHTWQREWTGGSAGGAHQRLIAVGLGDCEGPAAVEIRWPWAGKTTMSDLEVDKRHAVERPSVVSVEPRQVVPGQSYTVTYRGEGELVTVSGQTMTGSESKRTATLVAPSEEGDLRIDVIVDGVPVRLRPRVRVRAEPAYTLVFDPSPPRLGRPTTAWMTASVEGDVWLVADAGVSIVKQDRGPPLRNWAKLVPTKNPMTLRVKVAGKIAGEPIDIPVLAAVDPARSTVELVAHQGQFDAIVTPVDALGVPVVGDDVGLSLLRDGVKDTSAEFSPALETGGYQVTVSGSAPFQIAVEGVLVGPELTAANLNTGDPDPARSLLFPLQATARADGQDLVTVLLYLANSEGQPLTLLPGTGVQADGLKPELPTVWNEEHLAGWRVFSTRLRTDKTVGLATITAFGLSTQIRKLPPSHPEPVALTSEVVVEDGRVVAIPRDADGRLCGSGVQVAITGTGGAVGEVRYDGNGRYAADGTVAEATASFDGLFELTGSAPTPPPPEEPRFGFPDLDSQPPPETADDGDGDGGCCQLPAGATPSGFGPLALVLGMLAMLGLSRRRRRQDQCAPR